MSKESKSPQSSAVDPRDLKIAEQARTISELTAQVKELEETIAKLEEKLTKLEALLASQAEAPVFTKNYSFEGSCLHRELQSRSKQDLREETEQKIDRSQAGRSKAPSGHRDNRSLGRRSRACQVHSPSPPIRMANCRWQSGLRLLRHLRPSRLDRPTLAARFA